MVNLDLNLSDIDIKFTRNRTDNPLVKTQGLQNQLEAGIHPQIAIGNVGLYSDPEQVYLDSLPIWKNGSTQRLQLLPVTISRIRMVMLLIEVRCDGHTFDKHGNRWLCNRIQVNSKVRQKLNAISAEK